MLSKRDVKKSYYVWFLGAQEARAARGVRPALAALHRLERRAHDLDPFKVTLQVSPKGLKIIQNVDGRVKGGRGRNHTVKHFLPSESVTEVVSRGDAVVCVLLLYNPVTRCPLHAHAYRCDSEQTAQALASQLRAVAGLGPEEEEEEEPIPLEDSPEPIEQHSHPVHEARLAPEQEIAAEKLAAELRKRLAGREPLLLPPRDYDTMRKGPAPVPVQGRRSAKGVLGSSAGSSGIGSDLAPSPERPHTSSEEDWTESTAYMLHDAYESSARRARSPSPIKPTGRNVPSSERPIIRSDRQQNHSVSPKDRFNVAKEKFMNLEREKLSEEMEKRAQMRRNLNNILSRGPKTPGELQSRSNPKWPSDEEDIVVERRTEMPRPMLREQRSYPRDERDVRERSSRDYRDVREPRDVRDPRESRDVRDPRESRDIRDARDPRDSRDRDVRDMREVRERSSRDYREVKEPLDMREFKNVKPLRESKEREDYRNYKEEPRRDDRYLREERTHVKKDAKYLREYREVDEIREEDVRRNSRERTPRLEQRYFEYRPERQDRFFDNRYKHDPRSDDEGVESEKHFDEIRYVPHAEFPKRRDQPERRPEPQQQPKRDGRIELLEERQRQMETRMDRRPPSKDWEVLRRSYAEAEQRPRRDPRARHSYAEPVSRTRVGMATVAPF